MTKPLEPVVTQVNAWPDNPRTKAALAAYQDAMRRCQTWRYAVRSALAAADAVKGPEKEAGRNGFDLAVRPSMTAWRCLVCDAVGTGWPPEAWACDLVLCPAKAVKGAAKEDRNG